MRDYNKELLFDILNNMNKKDALAYIFNYISKQISFDNIACYAVNRSERIMTLFLEYGKSFEITKINFRLEELVPHKHYIEIMRKGTKEVVVKNTRNSDNMKNFTNQMHYVFGSYACFVFDFDEKANKFMVFTLVSKDENNFSDKDRALLNDMRPILIDIISSLYKESPESYEYISLDGNLPQNYYDQLKACFDLRKVVKSIEILAPYDTTVFIHGATGSGKELVASTLHSLSKRAEKPFIAINCAAIPESLLESELFGYEKGAFTGAIQMKKGFFEQAEGGTIFLDEVGELSLSAQSRLLRVLDNKKIQRVGGDKIINLDIRIIAATHRNLLEMVKLKTFREDLYYRLSIVEIDIPPLTARKKDIRTLTEYFYKYYTKKMQLEQLPTITSKGVRALMEYSWPGNVRELRAVIEKSIINSLLENKEELDFSFLAQSTKNVSGLKSLTDEDILHALESSNWRIQGKNGAATILGVPPSSLRSRMRYSSIPFKKTLLAHAQEKAD